LAGLDAINGSLESLGPQSMDVMDHRSLAPPFNCHCHPRKKKKGVPLTLSKILIQHAEYNLAAV